MRGPISVKKYQQINSKLSKYTLIHTQVDERSQCTNWAYSFTLKRGLKEAAELHAGLFYWGIYSSPNQSHSDWLSSSFLASFLQEFSGEHGRVVEAVEEALVSKQLEEERYCNAINFLVPSKFLKLFCV